MIPIYERSFGSLMLYTTKLYRCVLSARLFLFCAASAIIFSTVSTPAFSQAPVQPMLEVFTNRTVIPEGTTALILIKASTISSNATVNLELDTSGLELNKSTASLSLTYVELSSMRSQTTLALSVMDAGFNTLQTENGMITVDLTSSSGATLNPPSLTFTVPPNDLNVALDSLQLFDDPQGMTSITGKLTVKGLQARKGFILTTNNASIVRQDGIVVTVRDSFSANLGLLTEGSLKEGEVLSFKIDHLDALNPSARMNAEISAAVGHACSIKADGRLACWPPGHPEVTGPNDDGGTFLTVRAGSNHTCAIKTDNTLRCWGRGEAEKVGGPNDDGGTFLDVDVGNDSTCAIRTDNTPICWGADRTLVPSLNKYGKSGNTLLTIDVGTDHVCGIKTDNTVQCWESFRLMDSHGQASPPSDRFLAVSAGAFHACGIKIDGTVKCWGSKSSENTSTEKLLAISAGWDYTCGIKTNNTVECLGAGGTPPTLVGQFLAIGTGMSTLYVCGVKKDGAVACSGDEGIHVVSLLPNDLKIAGAARIKPETLWLHEKSQLVTGTVEQNGNVYTIAFDPDTIEVSKDSRGQVTLSIDPAPDMPTTVTLNNPAADQLTITAEDMTEEGGIVFTRESTMVDVVVMATEKAEGGKDYTVSIMLDESLSKNAAVAAFYNTKSTLGVTVLDSSSLNVLVKRPVRTDSDALLIPEGQSASLAIYVLGLTELATITLTVDGNITIDNKETIEFELNADSTKRTISIMALSDGRVGAADPATITLTTKGNIVFPAGIIRVSIDNSDVYTIGFEMRSITIEEGMMATSRLTIRPQLTGSTVVVVGLINENKDQIFLSTNSVSFTSAYSSTIVTITVIDDRKKEEQEEYPIDVEIIRIKE